MAFHNFDAKPANVEPANVKITVLPVYKLNQYGNKNAHLQFTQNDWIPYYFISNVCCQGQDN